MVRRCIIEGCPSRSRHPEHVGVTFHSFPFDSKTRDIWIENCRLGPDKNITKNILVCSRHFRRADFQPMKSGKYFLKNGVWPSVFPWGKLDSNMKNANSASTSGASSIVGSAAISVANSNSAQESSTAPDEVATDSKIKATIAQIMAETEELNRAAGIGQKKSKKKSRSSNASPRSPTNSGAKPERPKNFTTGLRLEVQELNGQWHSAKIIEVDNDEREILIKFEKSVKSKRTESEEWIPMSSPRIRKKMSGKPIATFVLHEKCFARWTGSRKFPAIVVKVFENDMYEVLFDDGLKKVVHGSHMSKPKRMLDSSQTDQVPEASTAAKDVEVGAATTSAQNSQSSSKGSKTKKLPTKDWPLLSMKNLNLASLNLPEIPKDGEWTCHWVNDQPIGREGFLLIGEHKKPTVIVDDWRLPPNWVKHMYQRSNVLGKWDVILVNPNGKRFRTKTDLKQALEEAGQVYNPDIYDFSIHRRRAKDINAYAYTADYKPPPKPLSSSCNTSTSATNPPPKTKAKITEAQALSAKPRPTPLLNATVVQDKGSKPGELLQQEVIQQQHDTPSGSNFAFIGGMKIQIINNLFHCPQKDCCKTFRKENHLQIHIKHYHKELAKKLGSCPNMQDLALKRTFERSDAGPAPKKQMINRESLPKIQQQDADNTCAPPKPPEKSPALPLSLPPEDRQPASSIPISADDSIDFKTPSPKPNLSDAIIGSDVSLAATKVEDTITEDPPSISTPGNEVSTPSHHILKRSRFLLDRTDPMKKNRLSRKMKRSPITSLRRTFPGSRRSNRQRVTNNYVSKVSVAAAPPPLNEATASNVMAETPHPLKPAILERPRSVKSQKFLSTSVTDTGGLSDIATTLEHRGESPKYIQENGELIKIVRMKQEEIINCVCSFGEEDGLMIQCELCLCWQHGSCNGIEKEVDVPEKYICYICRNPERGRESRKHIHDQDWLYQGRLPVASFHEENPQHPERYRILQRSHVLSGNLVELKRYLHSLQVKMNIAGNKDHPKMYLWEKPWESASTTEDEKPEETTIKTEEDTDVQIKEEETTVKVEAYTAPKPRAPQPEAAIDPVECQKRLVEHIKLQQKMVMSRLQEIEDEISEIENDDNLNDLKVATVEETTEVLATVIKELDTMKTIGKINALENLAHGTSSAKYS